MKALNLTVLTLVSTLTLSGCVTTNPAPGPGPDQPPPPPAQLNDSFTTAKGDYLTVVSRNGAQQRGKVTICLRNGTGNRKWKGMHWKNDKPKKARYVAKGSGKTVCGTHPAKGVKTWYFYKTGAFGIKKLVGKYRINQGQHANRTIMITWVND